MSTNPPPTNIEVTQCTQELAEAICRLITVCLPKKELPRANDDSEFINSKMAAKWLGIPVRSLQQYVQTGLLPSYKLGKHRLFRRKELLVAVGANRRASIAEILR
jgi:excisionase family DNA binding protein